jgi:hypothetical protein
LIDVCLYLAAAAARYRRWTLNPEDRVDIVVRCEIDGVINNKGEDQLLSIKVIHLTDRAAQIMSDVTAAGSTGL